MTRTMNIILVSAGSVVATAVVGATGFFLGKRNVIKSIESGKIRVLSDAGKTEVRRTDTRSETRASS